MQDWGGKAYLSQVPHEVSWRLRVVFNITVVVVYYVSLIQLLATPWSIAHQAPLSMGFSRQEYYNELPFPTPSASLIVQQSLSQLADQTDLVLDFWYVPHRRKSVLNIH